MPTNFTWRAGQVPFGAQILLEQIVDAVDGERNVLFADQFTFDDRLGERSRRPERFVWTVLDANLRRAIKQTDKTDK